MAHEDPFSKNTKFVPLNYTDDKTLDILRIHPFFSASHFFFKALGYFLRKYKYFLIIAL
jgi:hypothetical protein